MYYIKPSTNNLKRTMSKKTKSKKTEKQEPEEKIEDRKPSYTDRLISHLCEAEELEDVDLKAVVESIRQFSKQYAKQYAKEMKEKENQDVDTLYFGKYKGKKIEDIKKFDAGYLLWLSRQSFVKDNLKRALREALSDN